MMKSATNTIFLSLGLAILNHSAANAFSFNLTHLYELNGNFNDSVDTLTIDSDPNGTIDPTGYTFDANEELSLSNGVNSSDYSLLLDFSFTNTSGYRKIIDFKNLTADTGLYNLNGTVNFFNTGASTTTPFTNNVMSRLMVTRDDITDLLTVYVDGTQQLQFTDSGNLGVFDRTDNIANFFIDDNATSQGEASGGFVDTVAIWNGALSSAEVASLSGSGTPVTAVPFGVSTDLSILILGGIFGAFRLRKKLAASK